LFDNSSVLSRIFESRVSMLYICLSRIFESRVSKLVHMSESYI
jgi:hypothetical protein